MRVKRSTGVPGPRRARARRAASWSKPRPATSATSASRPLKWRYSAAGETPKSFAASASVKPPRPRSAMKRCAASISASLRLPW